MTRMAARELTQHRQINDEVKFYVLWKQWLGRRELLLDHPAHHHYLLLLRQREQLRLWLREQLWLRQRLRLLLIRNGVRRGAAPLFAALAADRLSPGHPRFGGIQQNDREFCHPAESAGFPNQPVEPLQTGFLPGLRGAFYISCEHIQAAAQSNGQRRAGVRAVVGHPKFLLGSAEADKNHIGPGSPDIIHHRSVLLEISIVGAADDQTGVSAF